MAKSLRANLAHKTSKSGLRNYKLEKVVQVLFPCRLTFFLETNLSEVGAYKQAVRNPIVLDGFQIMSSLIVIIAWPPFQRRREGLYLNLDMFFCDVYPFRTSKLVFLV